MTDTTTETTINTEEKQKQKNITREDVQLALGDTDPNSTNGGALLKIIGRGSLATIQKYLEEIRREKVVPIVATGDVPNAPKELVTALWQAAYTAAQSQSFNLVATATALKDQALARVSVLEKDIEACQVQEAELNEKLALAQQQIETRELQIAEIENTRRFDLEAYLLREQHMKDKVAEGVEALASTQRYMSHQEAMHQKQSELMRFELERLTDQIAELKAHLYQRAAAAEAAEDAPTAAAKKPAKKV